MTLLGLYGLATDLLAPAARLVLRWRAARGKEDAGRLAERLGHPALPRPTGPLVWAHGASVGESLALLPVVERLLQRLPHGHVLVTTGTLTSARLMQDRLPPRALHQFLPIDQRACVRRFLDHWQPDLALFAESEIWPNLLVESRRRLIPTILLNARMSVRSFHRWQRIPSVARTLFGGFALVLAQDAAQAERFAALGAGKVESVGDLKAAGALPPADPVLLGRFRSMIGDRPVWLAASTHPGEDEIVIAAHQRLVQHHPRLLTILAPRHPSRAGDVMRLIEATGIPCRRRSLAQPIEPETAIYLVDTLGDMGLFYRLAPIVLIAGSLGAPGSIGGHNPLEAAQLGCALLHGPDTVNCAAAMATLDAAGAATVIQGTAGLTTALDRLLSDPSVTPAMGAAARNVAEAGGGILDAIHDAVEPWLAALGGARSARIIPFPKRA